MNLKKFLRGLDFSLSEEELSDMRKETELIANKISGSLVRNKIKARVFVGGSFAKKTLMKNKDYDIDIFVRFENGEEISEKLGEVVRGGFGGDYNIELVHGSRDYFRVWRDRKVVFEIIPVLDIKSPKYSENVTDLSYFHVNYVKRRLKGGLAREVLIAKKFLRAQGVYGAESYIQGISGYGLECLIIYYRSFEKMAKGIVKIKDKEIIDIEKKYKNKKEILLELNESKLTSPIVMVDPTWKERNVLAALSLDTFEKLQKSLRKFIKNPGMSYFEEKEISEEILRKQAKKSGADFVKIKITTDKQEGDIAGTKLKKFSNFLKQEIGKSFNIKRIEFDYNLRKSAFIYLILKSKKEIVRSGPPVKMEKHAQIFRAVNKRVFEKKGKLYCKVKVPADGKKFIKNWLKKNNGVVKEMGITFHSLN